MKNWMLLSLLICSGFVSAQTNTFRKLLEDSTVTLTLGFQKFAQLPQSLTVCNRTTNLTEKYLGTDQTYFRSNPTNLPISLSGITIDSFNPNGATNLQTALGMGLVRTLLKL